MATTHQTDRDVKRLATEVDRDTKRLRDDLAKTRAYIRDLYDWAVVAAAAIPTPAPPEPPF